MKRRKPRYIPVRVTGKIYHIPVRPFVVGVAFSKEVASWLKLFDAVQRRTAKSNLQLATALILGSLVLFSGCSAWRLRTPEFREGPQTNNVGEVWTPK